MSYAGNHSLADIRNPGALQVSVGAKGLFGIFILIGVAVFFAGLSVDPKHVWSAFLINHFFFLSLAVGGTFVAAIQWLTGAMWSAPVRRVAEAFTAFLPISLLTLIVVLIGLNHVYSWTDMHYVHGSEVLRGKTSYLSPTFFGIRNVIAVLLWIFFSWMMVKNSLAQDTDRGNYAYTQRNRVLAPIFLVVFALTFTLASFDQVMSVDPTWYSTMFGVYCFAGLFYAVLALMTLVAIYLRRKMALGDLINDNHVHDMGKFMFAFTIFWAYIAFSQFMLIWYANIPEETGYFLHRMHEGWYYISAFLLFGKFMVPFFFLLPRDAKRDEKTLIWVGIFMVVAHWIDIMWVVQPEFFHEGPHFGWIEAGITLGFIGLFGMVVSRFLSKYNVIAIGDPRLVESVYHHHQ